MTRLIILLPWLLLSFDTIAEQRIKLESSAITGNSELPKILYVVPWKRLSPTVVDYKLTVHGINDDVLKPIDPEEFQRQSNNYSELINANTGK